MLDANYHLLLAAARLLEPLLDDLVFVGGCATGLMITDEAAPGVRPTVDVDAIAEITSYAESLTSPTAFERLVFPKTQVKVLLFVVGNTVRSN